MFHVHHMPVRQTTPNPSVNAIVRVIWHLHSQCKVRIMSNWSVAASFQLLFHIFLILQMYRLQQVYDKISRCQILWNQPHNCEHLATLIHTNEGTTKYFGEDRTQNTHNKLTVVNFHSRDDCDYPHMKDLKQLSSSLIYSPVLVSWFILNCLNLPQQL